MFYPHAPLSDPAAMQAANEASRDARRASGKVDRMEFDIERLLMITEALWMILKEQHGYSDEELQRRVMEIDVRDGRLDGKVAASAPDKCTKCGKVLMKKRPRCIYCGHVAPPNPFHR